MLFGCLGALLAVTVDEGSMNAYEMLRAWLSLEGVEIAPVALRREYRDHLRSGWEQSEEAYPAVDLVGVWKAICAAHRTGPKAEPHLARRCVLMFRACTVRKATVLPGTVSLLESLAGTPLGVVSDGQAIVGETELRRLGLLRRFDACVWASDYGYGKPDRRLFCKAAKQLGVSPRRTLFIGSDPVRDLAGALAAGTMACHRESAA